MKLLSNIKLKYLYIVLAVGFAIPSVGYLLINKSAKNYADYFTFFLKKPESSAEAIVGALLFILFIILLFVVYMLIIKKSNEEFKTVKQVFIIITVVSLIFMVILPFTSSDVYYYMTTGRMDAEYGVNPFYTTMKEVAPEYPEDEFLNIGHFWENLLVVYGPVWEIICKILAMLSFGNVTIALYLFKLLAVVVHMANCFLIYKTTRKKKFVLLYGLNPFILFEMITNAHNDIYMVFFMILAIYFLLRKKNILLMTVFLALGAAIKYVAILLFPFLLLYYFRKEPISKRILKSIPYVLLFLGVWIVCYLPYAKDFQIFVNVFLQQNKYKESLILITSLLLGEIGLNSLIGPMIPLFLIVAIFVCVFKGVKTLEQENLTIIKAVRNYSVVLVAFIIFGITNLCVWYLSWVFPVIFWLRGKNIKKWLYVQIFYEISLAYNFILNSEDARIGILYIPTILAFYTIMEGIEYYKTRRKELGKQKIGIN